MRKAIILFLGVLILGIFLISGCTCNTEDTATCKKTCQGCKKDGIGSYYCTGEKADPAKCEICELGTKKGCTEQKGSMCYVCYQGSCVYDSSPASCMCDPAGYPKKKCLTDMNGNPLNICQTKDCYKTMDGTRPIETKYDCSKTGTTCYDSTNDQSMALNDCRCG